MNIIALFHTSILQHLKKSVQNYRTTLPKEFRIDATLNDVREGGGAFGKMGKAKEDDYFYKKTKKQIESLRDTTEGQIKLVTEYIEKHKGDVRHYEEILKELKEDIKKLGKK